MTTATEQTHADLLAMLLAQTDTESSDDWVESVWTAPFHDYRAVVTGALDDYSPDFAAKWAGL